MAGSLAGLVEPAGEPLSAGRTCALDPPLRHQANDSILKRMPVTRTSALRVRDRSLMMGCPGNGEVRCTHTDGWSGKCP